MTDVTAEQVEAFQAAWLAENQKGLDSGLGTLPGQRTTAGLRAVFKLNPVKPGREDIARAMYAHRMSVGDFPDGGTDWDDLPEPWREEWLDAADAVLSLLPGRTEAVVKAEAWDEATEWLTDEGQPPGLARNMRADNPHRADEIERGEGR